jgi:coenzyme A diphosphatase NUDT7
MSASSSSSQRDHASQRLRVLAGHIREYQDPPIYFKGASSVRSEDRNLPIPPGKKRAALLVCLFQDENGEVRVILTKRSSRLRNHSGDAALPGGKQDPGEDDVTTALREAHEEIGLAPSQVCVARVLEPFISVDYMVVVPVTGHLKDPKQFKPVPNPGEVDDVFDCPLEIFLKKDNYSFVETDWLGAKYHIHILKYTAKDGRKFKIVGFTAGVLIRTAVIVFERHPEFEDVPAFLRMWSHLPEAMQMLQ